MLVYKVQQHVKHNYLNIYEKCYRNSMLRQAWRFPLQCVTGSIMLNMHWAARYEPCRIQRLSGTEPYGTCKAPCICEHHNTESICIQPVAILTYLWRIYVVAMYN